MDHDLKITGGTVLDGTGAPTGADRLVSDATGIDAVVVNGTVIRRDRVDTVTPDGPLPGRLLRNGRG